jgi:hypothetical protein
VGPLWKPERKNRSSGSRRKEGLPFKEIPLRGPVATSEPAVNISAKGRDEPVVRNLPEVKPRTLLLGVSCTDTPLQGASTSSIPTKGDPRHLVSGVGGLHLAKKVLSGCDRWKLKRAKAKASEAGTGGIQQLGNVDAERNLN